MTRLVGQQGQQDQPQVARTEDSSAAAPVPAMPKPISILMMVAPFPLAGMATPPHSVAHDL
jgi:hypothetical protein